MDQDDLDTIVEARIHPAIGIARVGNAPGRNDYFIGPEVPNRTPAPKGGYRDAQGRLKRQAARFRIYGYDRNGKVVGELTDDIAEIEWRVHVANKKAAWYNFDVALDLPESASIRSPRRNAQIQGANRACLTIDPGERSVYQNQKHAYFNTGEFFGKQVDLGEIRYYEKGSLLFLGGHGLSAPASPQYTITGFANNAGWHDDTSDGPVAATVRLRGRDILREIPVDSAWVVTAPPNYAPDLVATQPLYDVLAFTMESMVAPEQTPSFARHILPIFEQFADAQWVNAGFAALFGWHGLTDFTRPEFIRKLATPPVTGPNGKSDPYGELRLQIFQAFRDPAFKAFDPVGWPPLYGDVFGSFDNPTSPRVAFAVTRRSYAYLQAWSQGNFIADYNPQAPEPQSLMDVVRELRPDTLDRAALHFCIGGPFHPGCEMTWPVRNVLMYRAPFRFRPRPIGSPEPDYGDVMTAQIATADGGPLSASGPGDITRWMAVPWQSDTASCGAGYPEDFPTKSQLIPAFWPSRVPNTVLTEDSYRVVMNAKKPFRERWAAFFSRELWNLPLNPQGPWFPQMETMIDHFHELGIIERRKGPPGGEFPSVIYVQTLPRGRAAAAPPPSTSKRMSAMQAVIEAQTRRKLPDR
jgi:hypothetical protein